MRNLILLIFTAEDLAAVPQAVQRLKTMGIERLWVMHNPHLGLPYPATAKALDEEIGINERGKTQAIARENFTDATKYRDMANELRVRRDLEIKNGYKGIPEAQIQGVYNTAFAAISQQSTGIPNILIEAIADPLSPDQVFQYLHSQTAQWVDQFPHGEYGIVWVRALADSAPVHAEEIPPRTAFVPVGGKPDDAEDGIRELRSRAKELGINSYGKSKLTLAKEIAEHTAKPDLAPA